MAIQEVPSKVDLLAQTGSIPTQLLFAVGPLGGGIYMAAISVLVTTAGSGGTVTCGISWTNGITSAGFDSATFNLNAIGEQSALLGNFYASANQNITFNTTVANSSGSPVYNLRIRLLYLG